MSIKYSGMIIKVAWRNVWRSKIRSAVVIMAVALGLWAGIFTTAFMYGISTQRLEGILDTQISHLQIHHPSFDDNLEIQYTIPDTLHLLADIENREKVKYHSDRIVAPGMMASATSGAGVIVKGIDPRDEKNVTVIHEKITEGTYFEERKKNQIVVGEKLANKLNVSLRSKVVLNIQDKEGNITAGAFRITGMYKTSSAKYDESTVFVRAEDLSKLLGLKNEIHEIALILTDDKEVDAVKASLGEKYADLKVESWKDLAPELDFMNSIMDEYLQIFMIIILLAMAFGIINTMLMAVLERIHELGMLMAIGMNKWRIFVMIVLETIFLTFTGTPIGILMSILSIRYFHEKGFDLSLFSEGLANFDLDTIIYPTVDSSFYPTLIIMVTVTAILSAIYPAYKALSLDTASAIRTV